MPIVLFFVFVAVVCVCILALGHGLSSSGEQPVGRRCQTSPVLPLLLLCVAGVDGYFKRVGPAWTAKLGWSVEELLSRPFAEFVHPDDRPGVDTANTGRPSWSAFLLREPLKYSDGSHFTNRFKGDFRARC